MYDYTEPKPHWSSQPRFKLAAVQCTFHCFDSISLHVPACLAFLPYMHWVCPTSQLTRSLAHLPSLTINRMFWRARSRTGSGTVIAGVTLTDASEPTIMPCSLNTLSCTHHTAAPIPAPPRHPPFPRQNHAYQQSASEVVCGRLKQAPRECSHVACV